MNLTELTGYLAATLTTVAFVPQALKALRERDTRSLSLGMYVTFTTGVVLWAVYGYRREDWAIVLANAVTGTLCLVILGLKIRESLSKPPIAAPAASLTDAPRDSLPVTFRAGAKSSGEGSR
jgi:MtN3 and saliva related transmembrane protein